MYEINPKRTNNKARDLSLILFICGILIMYFSSLPMIPFPAIFQILSILLLSFSLMLIGRFLLKSYIYSIIGNDDGTYDLTVTEIKKKSRITVCRVAILGIEEIIPLSKETRKLVKKKKKGRKSFDYRVDLFPNNSHCILCEECGEEFAIIISEDEKLIKLLSPEDN